MKEDVGGDQLPVASLDLTDPKNVRKIEFWSALMTFLFIMLFCVLVSTLGFSYYWMLLVVVLLIPGAFLHEMFHYLFQWLFSGLKPHIGFKFPFLYSALAPYARITRNQGIFCALAPFLFVTPILVLFSLFMSPLPKLLFWAWASVHAASSFGDFFLISWLLRYPRRFKLGNVNLSNALFEIPKAEEDNNLEKTG